MSIMKNLKIGLTVFLVLLVISVGNCIRNLGPSKPLADRLDAHWQELLMQINGVTVGLSEGDDVVILHFDKESAITRKGDLKSVYHLLEQRGITVRSVEEVAMDENYTVNFDPLRFPYSEYLRVARLYPDADAVLSLCGFPVVPVDGALPDPMSLPPLLLTRVASIRGTVGRLLNEGRIAAVVTYREQPGPGNDFEDIFELFGGKGMEVPQKSSVKREDR